MRGNVAIVLAAGQGTRMKSKTNKVLHELAGKPMVHYVIEAIRSASVPRVILVVGHEAEQVRQRLGNAVEYALQSQQLGTGHAVLQAAELLDEEVENVLVMCGDTPLIREETLKALLREHGESNATVTMLTARAEDPRGYGRVLRADGRIVGIVEEGSATAEQESKREVNSGVYCFQAAWLRERLPNLQKSSKGEYYLTDVIAMAADADRKIAWLSLSDLSEALGVNDRVQLAEAEVALRWRIRRAVMLSGTTLLEPAMTFIDHGVEIGRDTIVYPGTFVKGNTKIGEDCVIGPNAVIADSTIGDKCQVFASVIENCTIEDRVSIGPFSHFRGGTHVAADVFIGNFAEAKNSYIGTATKMHHFSYLGDATVGSRVNIAAGTITCNFDSETGKKSRTILEDDVALGSDTLLVAPVRLAKGAATGAGAVVTKDVPSDSLAVGIPARVIRKLRKSK